MSYRKPTKFFSPNTRPKKMVFIIVLTWKLNGEEQRRSFLDGEHFNFYFQRVYVRTIIFTIKLEEIDSNSTRYTRILEDAETIRETLGEEKEPKEKEMVECDLCNREYTKAQYMSKDGKHGHRPACERKQEEKRQKEEKKKKQKEEKEALIRSMKGMKISLKGEEQNDDDDEEMKEGEVRSKPAKGKKKGSGSRPSSPLKGTWATEPDTKNEDKKEEKKKSGSGSVSPAQSRSRSPSKKGEKDDDDEEEEGDVEEEPKTCSFIIKKGPRKGENCPGTVDNHDYDGKPLCKRHFTDYLENLPK